MVALKFIAKLGKKEEELAALGREIAIMAALRHTHIIQLYNWFQNETEVRGSVRSEG